MPFPQGESLQEVLVCGLLTLPYYNLLFNPLDLYLLYPFLSEMDQPINIAIRVVYCVVTEAIPS